MIYGTVEMLTHCPYCGEQHECVTAATEQATPYDDDVTVCWQCGRPGIFDTRVDGCLRKPTKREQRDLDDDENLQQILAAWRARYQ